MSKYEIMNFLDKYPGILFKVDDIKKEMCDNDCCIGIQSVYAALRGIKKRRNYECIIVLNNTGHKVKLYRRI